MGSLKKLSVLALQHNRLNGPIPASLGDLEMLKILNLSVNRLSGFIPARLANIAQLEVLDVRNNTLSGDVPPCKLFSSLLVSFDQMPYFKCDCCPLFVLHFGSGYISKMLVTFWWIKLKL